MSRESKDGDEKGGTLAEFERRAMERLGGSIAFVMKGKTVVWSGTAGHDERTKQR